jgi:hypothetical protein
LVRAIALMTTVVLAATLAACANPDCSYYGSADASARCVVTGPAPTGGYH